MPKIIVNADDLGLCNGTNDGIIQAIENGILTSTSIMACGQAFDHAVQQLKKINFQTVGVHLVLDEERPLLPPEQISTIVDNRGHFLDRGTLLKRLILSSKIDLNQVKQEFRAQIQKCLNAGLSISHLDGHGHVHVYPQVNKVVCQLAKEFRIQKVRLPLERISFVDLPNLNLKKYINKCIVTYFSMRSKKLFRKAELTYPGGFMGMLFGGNLNQSNLQKVFSNLPRSNCIEIMSHPGEKDPKMEQRYAHWQYHWTDELNALVSIPHANLQQDGIELISFTDL